MPLPKIVFFDAVWTIIRPEPSVGHAYARVAAEHGHAVEAADINKAFTSAWRNARGNDAPPYGSTEHEARTFWARILRDTFREAGHGHVPTDHFFDDLYRRFATREFWRVYDDLEPAIRLLSNRGIRTGVLSNFDGRLHTLLRNLGIVDDFSIVIPSSEAAFDKPHPAIYEYAKRAAGVDDPGLIGHIGDEFEADGLGPAKAGWNVCLVDRDGELPPGNLMRARGLVEAVERLID